MTTALTSLDRDTSHPVHTAGREAREAAGRLVAVPETSFVLDLSDRLAVEYAGAVPPGRILACVVLAKHRLRAVTLDEGTRRDLIEASVRRELVRSTVRPPEPATPAPSPVHRAG